MFEQLTALGYGIITFAILIGVGTIILANFGGSVGCASGNLTGYTGYAFAYNNTASNCYNTSLTTSTSLPQGTSYTTLNYLNTQMGSTGGGLASWTPAIIAISVGLLFLGAFLIGKNGKGRY